MARILVGAMAGLLVLAAATMASAGIPDPVASSIDIGPDTGMATCPSGDGPSYSQLTVTAKRSDLTPIQAIPYSSFFFTSSAGDITVTAVEAETDVNGVIHFTVVADETIIDNTTIGVQIYTVVINDTEDVWCNSFDMNGDGSVGLQDFVLFSAQYNGTDPYADFNFDGAVGLQDFVLFSAHYNH